jgi:hypothetical protein
MRYIDVRLRIPVRRMGHLIEDILPDWAVMVGYDRLEQPKQRRNGKVHESGYKPGKGTAAEAILRVLKAQPLRRFEIIGRLAKTQKEKAVSSAVHGLTAKGIIVKNEDGTYERA